MSAPAPITNPKEIFFFASLYSYYTSELVYYDRYHCGTLKRNHWCTIGRNIQEASTKPSNTHIGRKISRIREIRGIKQEHLASELGVSQQSVSRMEQSEVLDDDVLDKIAKVLGVNSEAIKNYSDEATISFIANTYNDHAASYGHYYNFSPIEKIVTLYDEKIALLERLLLAEKEKNELLKGKQ